MGEGRRYLSDANGGTSWSRHARLSKLKFHDTPKHASWLNMVEIELAVLVNQCLKQRIPDVSGQTDKGIVNSLLSTSMERTPNGNAERILCPESY
jgi:hypothetical protein